MVGLKEKPIFCIFSGRSPLHYAFVKIGKHTDTSFTDPVALLSILLKHYGDNCDIDLADRFGNSPLHYAAGRGANICCITLLGSGRVYKLITYHIFYILYFLNFYVSYWGCSGFDSYGFSVSVIQKSVFRFRLFVNQFLGFSFGFEISKPTVRFRLCFRI